MDKRLLITKNRVPLTYGKLQNTLNYKGDLISAHLFIIVIKEVFRIIKETFKY